MLKICCFSFFYIYWSNYRTFAWRKQPIVKHHFGLFGQIVMGIDSLFWTICKKRNQIIKKSISRLVNREKKGWVRMQFEHVFPCLWYIYIHIRKAFLLKYILGNRCLKCIDFSSQVPWPLSLKLTAFGQLVDCVTCRLNTQSKQCCKCTLMLLNALEAKRVLPLLRPWPDPSS